MRKAFGILFSIIMCGIFVVSGVSVVSAADKTFVIENIGLEVTLPEDMLTITRDSESSDVYFSKFALDYDDTMTNFKEGNIYLQSMTPDSSVTFTVTMLDNDESRDIENYSKLSDDEIDSLKRTFLNNGAYKSCSITRYNGNTYLSMILDTKSGKKTVQAIQCHTVVNGKGYSFLLQPASGKKLSDDTKNLMDSILNSITIEEKNVFTEYKDIILYGGIFVLAAVFIAVLFIVLYKRVKSPVRKNKNLIHELAHEHGITETTKFSRRKLDDSFDKNFSNEYEPVESESSAKADVETRKVIAVKELDEEPDEVLLDLDDVISTGEEMHEKADDTEESVKIFDREPAVIDDPEEAVQAESGFEAVEDYFEDVPDIEDMYTYESVDSAVDDFGEEKREVYSRSREDKERKSGDVPNKILKVLKAIGMGILNFLKNVGLIICFIIIHCKYFCINVYRLIKKKIATKKRRKAEEEKKRRAAQRRRIQRESQVNKRRQNAARGENDLVMVHSRDDMRRNYQRSPEQRQAQRSTQRRPRR